MTKIPHQEIYTKKSLLAIIAICFISLAIGLISNFSTDQALSNYIEKQLQKTLPCAIRYQTIKTHYFPLGFQLQKVNIPPSCIPQLEEELQLDSIDLTLSLFKSLMDLSPSISFNAKNNSFFSLRGKTTLSQANYSVQLHQSNINIEWLNKILMKLYGNSLPFKLSANGNISIELILKTKNKKIQQFNLDLNSDDFNITSIDFAGMSLIPLSIGKMAILVETTSNRQELLLKKFRLGSKKHSLMVDFTGTIELSHDDFKQSPLQAQGKFWLGKSLLEIPAISLVKGYLNQFYKKEDESYHLSLGNTLGKPQIK